MFLKVGYCTTIKLISCIDFGVVSKDLSRM